MLNICRTICWNREDYISKYTKKISEKTIFKTPDNEVEGKSYFKSELDTKALNSSAPIPLSEQKKEELRIKLLSLICPKVHQKGFLSNRDLTDNDYREILEDLHYDNNYEFHNELVNLGLKSVSAYSVFSNKRATGKIKALKEYLGISEKVIIDNLTFKIRDNIKLSHTVRLQGEIAANERRVEFEKIYVPKLIQICLKSPEFIEKVVEAANTPWHIDALSLSANGNDLNIYFKIDNFLDNPVPNANREKISITTTPSNLLKLFSFPNRKQVYRKRIEAFISNCANPDATLTEQPAMAENAINIKLKPKLQSLIFAKISQKGLTDSNYQFQEEQLNDNDYRDILEQLHTADGGYFENYLNNLGLYMVSPYSVFPNKRATGKIEALKEFLKIDHTAMDELVNNVKNCIEKILIDFNIQPDNEINLAALRQKFLLNNLIISKLNQNPAQHPSKITKINNFIYIEFNSEDRNSESTTIELN